MRTKGKKIVAVFCAIIMLVMPILSVTPVKATPTKTGDVELPGDAVEEPAKLDSTLEMVTFNDFGIDNGTYTKTSTKYGICRSMTSLNGKVFNGDVTFKGANMRLTIGGNGDTSSAAWKGLTIHTVKGDSKALYIHEGGNWTEAPICKLKPDIAGTTLYGKKFNLKLSYKLVDRDKDGNVNDLQLGIWINDVLYDNTYIYLNKCGDKFLGNRMLIYTDVKDSSLKVASIVEQRPTEVLDSTLEMVTFKDFGIDDGIYTKTSTKFGICRSITSLNGKVFNGDVLFRGANMRLTIGGNGDTNSAAWKGLSIHTVKGDTKSLYIHEAGKWTDVPICKLEPEIAGTTLYNKTFNLKLSYKLVDRDGDGNVNDLQLGVWINGVLYGNKYIYLSNSGDQFLGNRMLIYTDVKDSVLKVASVVEQRPAEVLDPALEMISFDDFGLEDGSYTKGTKYGKAVEIDTLNGKVFSGDVSFFGKNMRLTIGGNGDSNSAAWKGLSIHTVSGDSQNLYIHEAGKWSETPICKLRPSVAGTTLYGKTFNLKLSYKLVDRDQDGNVNDLQLGVWINDVLYDNKYIYLNNSGDRFLGNWMLIYTDIEGSKLKIASVIKYVATIAGSRSAAPNTGDMTDVRKYVCMMAAAFVAMMTYGVSCLIKSGKREKICKI